MKFTTQLLLGALAGKVSGAGGGGFMLFFVPTERRMDVIQALSRFNGQVSNCHFTKNGSQGLETVMERTRRTKIDKSSEDTPRI